ncbi:DUF819 family protein [Marinibactrum halimedae]|uniref:DUF819 family protein n=1 Tax=Marinibactrum halimedae TaxID=1444977 RepID=A0AA37WMF5_9GAMM|nr:DUF819 family protein [Marinibactrum halimedae]MCD9457646.1 DUF819 family protein [Marinibactrum halimedae]GLS24981.1 hypothetical protein GCM10007877_06950 [Marinibactrum halimedae]
MSLITPDNHLAIMAVLFLISAAGFSLEKTKVGRQLTGAVIVILLTIATANLNIIPHQAVAYDFVFKYIVPMLIPLFLFKADLKRILFETTRTTFAFLIASIGTVLGVLIAIILFDFSSLATTAPINVDQREAAIAGLFTSSYIGGSVNYAALGEMTGLIKDASFFSAATATDNLCSAIFLGLLATLPGWQWLVRRFAFQRDNIDLSVPKPVKTASEHPVSAMSLCISIALSLSIVVVSDVLVQMFDLTHWRYILISVLALIIATLGSNHMRYLAGSFEMGVGLSFVFFAAIAAGADVVAMVKVAPLLIILVVVLLSVHLLVVLSVGRLFRLTLPELITASNAAILGATTAPALAAAKGWHDQVTPGVLVGVFGYALGTFVGSLVFTMLS